MGTLTKKEKAEINKLIKESAALLARAVVIHQKATNRVVNGTVNTTLQYRLKSAIEKLSDVEVV